MRGGPRIQHIDGQVAKAGCHVILEYRDVFGPWKADPGHRPNTWRATLLW